jgi:hypothetical protein
MSACCLAQNHPDPTSVTDRVRAHRSGLATPTRSARGGRRPVPLFRPAVGTGH